MYRLICILSLCLIAGAVISDDEPGPEQKREQSPANLPPQVQPPLPWLDAVRAQREFREEQRRAKKAAIEARRRQIDPWGAARKDAIEEETRLRREAFKDEVERNREALRQRSDWGYSKHPWYQPPPPPPDPSVDANGQRSASPESTYPPTGWNNRWYYQSH